MDAPQLTLALQEQARDRVRWEAQFEELASTHVQRVREEVAAERAAREEAEDMLLRTTEDIVAKLQAEVARERKTRRDGVVQLQRLLEDTSARLSATQGALPGNLESSIF